MTPRKRKSERTESDKVKSPLTGAPDVAPTSTDAIDAHLFRLQQARELLIWAGHVARGDGSWTTRAATNPLCEMAVTAATFGIMQSLFMNGEEYSNA